MGASAVTQIGKLLVGTLYLSEYHAVRPFELIRNIGNLSPDVVRAVMEGDEVTLDAYRQALGEPLYAANLCLSLQTAVNHHTHRTLISWLASEGADALCHYRSD